VFLIVIMGTTDKRASAGFAALAIGLSLTLIHLVSIPVTNTSVNPARSTGPAILLAFGGESWGLEQLWMFWVAPIIGGVAGVIVVLGVYAIDKKLDDPVGALSAHGLAGIWGTLACGIFTAPRLAEFNAVGEGGLWYTGSFSQLGAQALGVAAAFAFVFAASFAVFWIIKKTYGLRVSEAEEDAGLDITEHGMYGYPEQFIPAPELVGVGSPRNVPDRPSAPEPVATSKEVPA
jgi:Amt family ammonium transporter